MHLLEKREEIEVFIGERLAEAGVWQSSRDSDGISAVRTVDGSDARVGFCGEIWDIHQTLHTFWLDIES